MTTSRDRAYRLFLKVFALLNGLFAAALFVTKPPSFYTPLFQYSLLAALHALVLGSLIPLLFDRYYHPSISFRLAGMFLCVGEVVLVTGFLLHPRSALPAEGGILVFLGVLMGGFQHKVRSYLSIYWMALLASSLMGMLLGGVLMRAVIDPIPFSMIAVHGILGAGLGLYPMFWIISARTERRRIFMIPAVLGALLIWVLHQSLIHLSMLLFAISVLLAGSIGVTPLGRLGYLIFLLASCGAILSGWFLPGEWISMLGILLIASCYAGYFINGRQRFEDYAPGAETV